MKVKVLRVFKNKLNLKETFQVGSVIDVEVSRAEDLISRELAELVEVESKTSTGTIDLSQASKKVAIDVKDCENIDALTAAYDEEFAKNEKARQSVLKAILEKLEVLGVDTTTLSPMDKSFI